MRTLPSSSLALSLLLGVVAPAPVAAKEPRPVERSPHAGPAARGRFLGPHPIAARLGGGYCYLDVPHLHPYVPDRPALYQQVGDAYLFTGDPVPFGYEGPRTVFYGAHPVQVRIEAQLPLGPIYCALRGPHYHDYAAPEVPDYKVKDGVVFYVGPVAPEYARLRPRLERALDDEYRPFVALRPQVVVAPPPEWPGEVWVVPPPAPAVHVAPPPAPALIGTPARVHLFAPTPTVVVAAPAPPSLVITAPAPPSLVVTPPSPPGVILAPGPRWHHGKHKGWYKEKHHRGGWDD